MIRVGVTAPRVVRCETIRTVAVAGGIRVSQASLSTVAPGKPPEEMVEAAVLQHDDHHVLDARAGGIGEPLSVEGLLFTCSLQIPRIHDGDACHPSQAPKELTTLQVHDNLLIQEKGASFLNVARAHR
jgi:hypothetical protein